MPSLRLSSPRRALLIAFAAALLLAILVAPGALADTFTPESGGSPNADRIDSLYKIILYVAIVIFLLVEGTLLWSLVKYRARRDGPKEGAQIHGNTPLELGWTVGAALILVVLTVVTFLYLGDIRNPAPSGPEGLASGLEVASIDQPAPPKGSSKPLTVRVNGQQFLWRYEYPNGAFSYYELVAPVDTTVVMKVTTSDVIHSWWIPKMFGKVDAVPGYVNETWFKASQTGIYTGQCAELCGSGHADMRARVRVVEPEQYTAFLARQERDIEAAQEALAAQREQAERGEPAGQAEQDDTAGQGQPAEPAEREIQ